MAKRARSDGVDSNTLDPVKQEPKTLQYKVIYVNAPLRRRRRLLGSDPGMAVGLHLGYDRPLPALPPLVRYLWAAPTTAIGALVVLAGLRRAEVRVVDGVLEAHGPTLAWMLRNLTCMPGGACALTLGHVVIGQDHAALESTRAHERVHVRQCEAWGPLFVPAYLAASLVAAARGRSAYYDNRFEIQAYASGVGQPVANHSTAPGEDTAGGA